MTTHHDPRNCDCAAHRSHSFLALADMQLRAEKAEQKRDERDAAAHAWKEHSREMFRQRQDARTELDRFQRLAGGWITEAQSETTEAVTRAEAAELRAEKAEQEPTDAEVEAAAVMIARDVSYDADPNLSGYRIVARTALSAARAVRNGASHE